MKFKYLLILFLIIIPYFFIYQAFFSSNHLVFGDAPFFYAENLKELFNKPFAWDYRNDNFGAPQNFILWLSLPTFLYGLLNNLFGFSNDFLIRIVFYFPATILAILGSWVFISQFSKNIFAKLLGSLLYGFNTYLLLLIDGGQLGVALSYGLFPLVILLVSRYLQHQTIKNFTLALLFLFLLSNVDLRTFILTVLFVLLMYLFQALVYKKGWGFKSLVNFSKQLFFILMPLILLDGFWLLPVFLSSGVSLTQVPSISNLNLITLTDSLLLFQPHFPLNEFGKIFDPPFYFGFIPFLLLSGLIFKSKLDSYLKKDYLIFLLLFLTMVYLAKGGSAPFGEIYTGIINTLPFGSIFRDSSKFFIPLMLVASTLITLSIENLINTFPKKPFYVVIFAIYCYLFLLVNPALFSGLTGALSKSPKNTDEFELIYQNLKSTNGFFRTLWFSERPALGFANWDKPALSANTLFKEPPFASMIQGEYDLFYFLHDSLLQDWLRTLGVRFVFFPEDQRKKTYTDQEMEDRQAFLKFVDSVFSGQRVSSISIPTYKDEVFASSAYQISDTRDHIFTQKKVIITAAQTDLYEALKQKYNFDLSVSGAIFIQDRLLNPQTLLNLPKDAAVIFVRDQDLNTEVTMSFLKSRFLNLGITKGDWGLYKGDEYLKWRYELLLRNINTKDLAYKDPVLYSSINGEKFNLPIEVKSRDNYYLAIRHIEASNSGLLNVNINDVKKTISANNKSVFKWNLLGPFELQKGMNTFTFENLGGFKLINEIALINEEELNSATSMAKQLINNFPVYDLENQDVKEVLNDISGTNAKITYTQKDPTNYTVKIEGNTPTWVVFSDHFDNSWKLGSRNPYPLYGMINGFWVDKKDDLPMQLSYQGQEWVDKGLIISISGFIVIAGIIIYILKKGER